MRQAFEIAEIKDASMLYGRAALIKRLHILAKRCENASIIGARRFGKTCLLKSFIYEVKKNINATNIYPVYIDFKTEDIKGTDQAYRYMISCLVVSLYKDGIYTSSERFGNINISPSDDWIDVDEQIHGLSSVKLQSTLKRVIIFFASFFEKTILFVIDEYEYLFKYVLDSPGGFMKLRELSTEVIGDDLRPFVFWISGALSWEHLCSAIGSGECNPISATEFVPPISKEEFFYMWKCETDSISDPELRNMAAEGCAFAWEKSGGVPFYGKLIGSFLVRNKKLPDYSCCASLFNEMLNKTLSNAEKNILIAISRGKSIPLSSVGVSSLKEKGIIAMANSKPVISIGFLKDFIFAENADISLMMPQKKEHEKLVDDISGIIENINKTRENKKRKYIFIPTVDSMSTYRDLKGPCYTSDTFAEFSCAIYRIYFEWTKETKPRDLLPNNEFKYNDFAQYVDIARHSLGKAHQMDTFSLSDGKKSKQDMLLEMTGSLNEPNNQDDFYKLQIEFLRRFKTTILQIQDFVRRH